MTRVYRFSKDVTDGNGQMRHELGGKGAGLAEMCRLGVPVPPGFTITTSCCIDYLKNGRKISDSLKAEILKNIAWLEESLGKSLGGDGPPLLLSVRSGARVSMPGMMDTILNLGLNDASAERLAELSNNPRFAYDSYRRFIQMYGNVVLGLDHSEFERILDETREDEGVTEDSQISAAGLKLLIQRYKAYVLEDSGIPFPSDPLEQLWVSIRAVFDSWENPRATFYRKIHDIDHHWGTAVNIQSMVFGNMGEGSGTGVCFSRNPSTGEPGAYGEYLMNAQGEDVVAGIRTPHPICNDANPNSMHHHLPEVYHQLLGTLKTLEQHFCDMQDTEFTIERGHLYLLQTRNGKRTSQASLRISIDLCKEGLIDEIQAIQKIDPSSMSQLLASEFDLSAKALMLEDQQLLAQGLNAGPGAATGCIALDAETAVAMHEKGMPVILVREETSPEDIAGMHVSTGILTQKGGMTSHAAVVARGMGKPCIVGCTKMKVDHVARTLTFETLTLAEGEFISIDGTTGEVIAGKIPTQESALIQQLQAGDFAPGSQGEQFQLLMKWVNKHSKLGVRTNADTPEDAHLARILGAEGIGLCRTEHMFFGEDRIREVRKMILASDDKTRQKALNALLPYQEADFFALFKAMDGLPVTIRLLDPPLHEFLPQTEELIGELAQSLDISIQDLKTRISDLHEQNPMLGHRGCRLGISQPSIYQMQVKAIVGATKRARSEGIQAKPEIMVPLISTQKELDIVKVSITPLLEDLDIPVGTMIEIPRAALTAGAIAQSADFFSFGTNDLTQCGMGLSRDDSGSFLPTYLEKGIFDQDPFKSLDQAGIGRLVQIACQEGRQAKPGLKLGVCGEHGGDPRSITFFYKTGLDYVSCSPFRVPVAKLAAVKASLGANR